MWFSLWVFCLPSTQYHFISDTTDLQNVKVFPCNKQFCDLNRMFENLTPVLTQWPGDSARFHTLRVQSHKRVHATAFAHTNPFQCQAKVQVTICISDQKAVDQHFQTKFQQPFLVSINLLMQDRTQQNSYV